MVSYGMNQEQKKLISAFTTMETRTLLRWVKGFNDVTTADVL